MKYSGPKFTVNVPNGWTDESTYVLAAPGGDFRATFVTNSQKIAADFSLDQYVSQQQQLLKSHLKSMSVIEPESKITVNGLNGRQMGFTSIGPDGQMLRQMQVYLTHKKRVYTLTFTQLAERFEADLPTFQTILGSFIFEREK